MPYQVYDPKTGVQTTYNGETADSGVAKVEKIDKTGSSAVSQANNPAPASTAKNTYGQNLNVGGQTISAQDPNYDTYAKQMGVQKPASSTTGQQQGSQGSKTQPTVDYGVDPAVMAKPGISNLLASGREFTEEDAKNFAYAKGEKNWQQYVGGVSGQSNPNYIGSTNWSLLQKKYTPYQLQQSTIRTKNGIYWNPEVNISEVPTTDPAAQINADASRLANIVSDARKDADKFTRSGTDDATIPKITGNLEDDKQTIVSMLNQQFGDGGAEAIYKELYDTPEMKAAQTDVNSLKSKLDEYDQQIDELQDDIQKEVEGEAPESYITALATVRGEKILKAKRSVQRDYDTALAVYNGLKENAANLLQVRVKDADTRYNQLFSMLQLEIQEAGTNFNQEMAIANLAMQIPAGRTMTINGESVKGLKENDDLNVVQFTAADGKTYVMGIDKKTGETKYKTMIGTAKVAGSGDGSTTEAVDLNTALYWLSLSKTKDGTYDLSKIPEKVRRGVVEVVAANKDSLPKTENKGWWARQWEDVTSGSLGDVVNPFD